MALIFEEFSSHLFFLLSPQPYKHILNLDGIELNKFMKGETINCQETLKGYVLVCYNNLPLGFGKASNGILKNKNEKGWLKCD